MFGVVSSMDQAAFKMNGGAGNDNTHPYIAMTGRVDVKVIGTVNKGDRLVSASVPGYARAATKAECIQNNQPCVVCLGKVTQILQLRKSRPRQRVGSDEIRGKMLNLELRICLFVSVVCFLLPKTTWLFSPQWW